LFADGALSLEPSPSDACVEDVPGLWSWVAQRGTKPSMVLPGEPDSVRLGDALVAQAHALGAFRAAGARWWLSVSGFDGGRPCALVANHPVRALRAVAAAFDEPSFLLVDGASGAVLGVDTEEWDVRLFTRSAPHAG
jgi:hypothetical protein